MRGFELTPELEELRAAAERLGRSELAPNVREHEAAGRWPAPVLAVLDGFPLGGLDLPEALGGVGAGLLAKVVVLEALAAADAGGLAARRPAGHRRRRRRRLPRSATSPPRWRRPASTASAHCAFTVVDPERRSAAARVGAGLAGAALGVGDGGRHAAPARGDRSSRRR